MSGMRSAAQPALCQHIAYVLYADLLGMMCDGVVLSCCLLRYVSSVLAVNPPSIH